MQLIDGILSSNATELWAETTPAGGAPFATRHGVRACAGLEYLAQAAAAFFTLLAQPGAPPRQGMLVACRRYHTLQPHYAFQQQLLLRVQLASQFSPDTPSARLVKFNGSIYLAPSRLQAVPEEEARGEARREELNSILADIKTHTAVSAADLSVYL